MSKQKRKKRTRYVELTGTAVKELCKEVQQALTVKQACDLLGLDHKDVSERSEEPKSQMDYDLAVGLAHARAFAVKRELCRLWAAGDAAQVKRHQSILEAIDPERFSRQKQALVAPGAVIVQIGIPRPDEEREVEIRALQRVIPAQAAVGQ